MYCYFEEIEVDEESSRSLWRFPSLLDKKG